MGRGPVCASSAELPVDPVHCKRSTFGDLWFDLAKTLCVTRHAPLLFPLGAHPTLPPLRRRCSSGGECKRGRGDGRHIALLLGKSCLPLLTTPNLSFRHPPFSSSSQGRLCHLDSFLPLLPFSPLYFSNLGAGRPNTSHILYALLLRFGPLSLILLATTEDLQIRHFDTSTGSIIGSLSLLPFIFLPRRPHLTPCRFSDDQAVG